MRRRGLGLLGLVLVFAAAAGVVVFAQHAMVRSSSRTLFSLQERRQLETLARSSLAEAVFAVQASLDAGLPFWSDWLRDAAAPVQRTVAPSLTRDLSGDIPQLAGQLEYIVSDVALTRRREIVSGKREGVRPLGILDLEVSITVKRASPYHSATLHLAERRWVRLAGDLGPFATAGKHLEVGSTPILSWEPLP